MNRRDLLRASVAAVATISGVPLARLAHAAPVSFYELEFPAPDGEPQAMADFLGRPMVLNFWATWCAPCIQEMPDLDFLYNKHPGISMVGLAVDTAANVVKFSEKVPVSYPLFVAGHGGIQLMKGMGNPRGGLPFTILFDAQGQPVRDFLGQVQRDDLDAVLVNANSV